MGLALLSPKDRRGFVELLVSKNPDIAVDERLMERVKKGRIYYVFPGGKGERGEVTQYYFHAAITCGRLATGDAEEFTTGEGTYELVWMKAAELGNHPVIPVEVVETLNRKEE